MDIDIEGSAGPGTTSNTKLGQNGKSTHRWKSKSRMISGIIQLHRIDADKDRRIDMR